MGCIERINMNQSRFTKTDRKISEYIQKHAETIPHASVESLASRAEVSPAAIIRFIKKLQYNSFSECKIDVAKNDIDSIFCMENLQFNKTDSIQSISRKIGATVTELFNQTIDMLNFKQLETTVAHLKDAEKIILLGIGASGLVAMDLQHKLLRIQKNCLYNTDAHMQIINANFSAEKDVVIAFSYRGETKEVIHAASIARKRGAYTIAITSNPGSPICKHCNACHFIPHNEGELRLGAIQSRYAQLLISDILYTVIAQENFDAVKEMILETRMIIY